MDACEGALPQRSDTPEVACCVIMYFCHKEGFLLVFAVHSKLLNDSMIQILFPYPRRLRQQRGLTQENGSRGWGFKVHFLP